MSDEDKPETPVIRLVPKRAPEPEAPPPPAVPPPVDEDILALLAEVTALVTEGKVSGIVVMLETKEEEGEGYMVRWTDTQHLTRRLGFLELAKAQQLSQIGWETEGE